MIGSCGDLYGSLDTTPERILYAIINVALIIVASILNISIIVLIRTRPILHQPSFFLLAALACTDLALISICGTMYLAIALSGLSKDGAIEMVNCVVTSSATINNLLLLCCITHDRYLCIKHSMSSRPYTTQRRVIVKIAVCVLTSLLLSLMFYIETVYSIRWRNVELIFLFTIVCFSYIAVFYFKLSRLVRANQVSNSALRSHSSNDDSMRRVPSRQSNLNRSILLLIGFYVVAYLPLTVSTIIRNALGRFKMMSSRGPLIASVWCMTLLFATSVMDPIIYTYRSDAIGRELRKVALLICCKF